MKPIKKLLLVLVLVLGVFALTGCDKKENNKNSIVGTWEYQFGSDYVYTFNDDLTGTYKVGSTTMEFTYKIECNQLSILYKGNSTPFTTDFSIKDNVLNVKDSYGNDTLYNKK